MLAGVQMKWVCVCNAINPQFSHQCHACGASRPASLLCLYCDNRVPISSPAIVCPEEKCQDKEDAALDELNQY
jgi:hypothetical protein